VINDIEFLSDLRVELLAVAERHSHPSGQLGADLEQPVASWRRRPTRVGVGTVVVVIACVAAIAVGGVAVYEHVGQHHTPVAGSHAVVSRMPGPPFSVSSPLYHGQVVSLAAASTAVGQQLPTPTLAAANPSAMGKVFEAQTVDDSGATDTYVAVTYPSDSLVVEYESPVYFDPATIYHAWVNETPANLAGLASVGQVGTHPALILQENKDATGSNPASVEFLVNGLKVDVIGYQSAATLLTIAQSIDANSQN
jgi:hypothetical protein